VSAGNLMKISYVALMLLAGLITPVTTNAGTSDGGCCAEFDQRVAELDAAVSRAETHEVEVHIYGKINSIYEVDFILFSEREINNSKTAIKTASERAYSVALGIGKYIYKDKYTDSIDNSLGLQQYFFWVEDDRPGRRLTLCGYHEFFPPVKLELILNGSPTFSIRASQEKTIPTKVGENNAGGCRQVRNKSG
jgi:hypothetical protein